MHISEYKPETGEHSRTAAASIRDRRGCIIAAVLALWNFLITLLWPLLYFYAPFRGTIPRRLGNFDLEAYDPAKPGLKVLINAVSAGEVVAITPFIRELLKARPDAQVALLTTTDSGQALARGQLSDMIKLLAYFPLADLPFVVRRYLGRLKPDLYITTEAELWPNIMNACRRRGIPVAQVNSRIYLHNKAGWRGRLHHGLYRLVDRLICQNEEQRENFLRFGIEGAKLSVSGNTKFDFAVEDWSSAQLDSARARYGVGDCRLLVAGSTHEGEEDLVLTALKQLRVAQAVKLIIAPRHIERVEDIEKLTADRGLASLRLSQALPETSWDVIIVDSYGVLVDMYRLADIVIMGGTFHEKTGGHNLLEATALGKPVIAGPHTFSITVQLEMLQRVAGVVAVEDGAALAAAIQQLLSDTGLAARIGLAAREATLANRGAAARAVEYALELVAQPQTEEK